MLTPAPLLLLAFAVHAQEADFVTLGRDHARFARELYKAGFVELAESFCTRFEQSPAADSEEVASVRSVHLDLKIELASKQTDPRAKLAALTELLKLKEEFIDAYPDSPEALAAQQTLPDVYAVVGEAYSDALKTAADDPGEAKRLREEGSDIFRRGEKALKDQVAALQEAADDQSLPESQLEALDIELMTAMYNLARTYYFHATLLGKDDPFGKNFLELAEAAFGEFGLTYSDRLLYFEGQVFQGLACKALGRPDDAILAFDTCIGLKDTFGPDETMPAPNIAVVAWGVQEKMALLTELKRYDEAIAAADDFLATKGVKETRQDLAILNARMGAEVASGESAAAQATAQLMLERAPDGYYADRAGEILGNLVGSSSGVGQKNLLKIAQSMAAKKDFEQSIKLCNQVIAASRASDKPTDDITEAFILAGQCNWWLNRIEEASVAYEAGYESNPSATKAADALYNSHLAYARLYKITRQPFFEKRADDRLAQLASKFPSNPLAAKQALSEAQKLEAKDEFAKAAEAFLRVAATSTVYPDAQYGAATNLYSDTVRLSKAKSPEVKAAATKAETQLRKAQKTLEGAAGKTLDLTEKANLEANAFQCVSLVGSLYMLDGVGRQNDVLALTKEMEEKYAGDEDKIGEARSLRVRALTAVGKVQEAEDFLEGLVAADPDSRSTALAAGVLARTFDQQAAELFAKDKDSAAGNELWKQAFRYYVLSLKPKLGDGGAGDELEQVANRLMIMGEHFNNVPEGVSSFVGLKEGFKATAPEYWEEAISFYEKSNSFKAKVNLARTLGYLGRFDEAADVYAEVVENEALIDPSENKINRSALAGRPELMSVYLEMGVAQLEQGKAERDDGAINNSIAIFDRIVSTAPKQASESWWRARYYQLVGMYEAGRYEKCLVAVKDLERNSNDFDEGKYGLNVRFKELMRAAERKVPAK